MNLILQTIPSTIIYEIIATSTFGDRDNEQM